VRPPSQEIDERRFGDIVRYYYEIWMGTSPVLPRMSLKYHRPRCRCGDCVAAGAVAKDEEYWSTTGLIHFKAPVFRGEAFTKGALLHENRHWVWLPHGYPQNDRNALADAAYLIDRRMRDSGLPAARKLSLAVRYGNILGDYVIHYSMSRQYPDLFDALYRYLVARGAGFGDAAFDLYLAAYAPLCYGKDPPPGQFADGARKIAGIVRSAVEGKISTKEALVELYDVMNRYMDAAQFGSGKAKCPACGKPNVSADVVLRRERGAVWAHVRYRCKDCGKTWEADGVLVPAAGPGDLDGVEITSIKWDDAGGENERHGIRDDVNEARKGAGDNALAPGDGLKGQADGKGGDLPDLLSRLPMAGMEKGVAESILKRKIDQKTWNEGLMKSIVREFLERDVILDKVRGRGDLEFVALSGWEVGDDLEALDFEASAEAAESTGLGMVPEVTMLKRVHSPRGRGEWTFRGARLIVMVDTSGSMFDFGNAKKVDFALKFAQLVDRLGRALGFERTFVSFSGEAMRTDEFDKLVTFRGGTCLGEAFAQIRDGEFDRSNIFIISDADLADFRSVEERVRRLAGRAMSFKIITVEAAGVSTAPRMRLEEMFRGTKVRCVHLEVEPDGTLRRLGELK